MKSLYIALLVICGACTTTTIFAQAAADKSETIKVWGNCSMCEETIEKAAKKAGAVSAAWNEETKMLAVSYNPEKSNSYKIQQAIAQAGYDTQDLKGNSKAYDKLHGCCKYDRKPDESKTEPKEVAAHTCNGTCCK